MNPNPFAGLVHSRKFWLLILDTIISAATYFVVKYTAPEYSKDVLFMIGLLQPVFVTVIVGIFAEDNAQRKMDAAIYNEEVWAKQEAALAKKDNAASG
jgi:hypothetical protein